MSIKDWYFTEGNRADSSYTDFTSTNYNNTASSYTDFTGYGSSYSNRNSESFRNGYNDYAGFGGSSYTDFAAASSGYTDFTVAASTQPAWNRTVRKAKVRNFKGSGKKSGAGKVIACSLTVIAVLLACALGAKYYMADNTNDGGNFFQNLFVNSGSKDPNNKAGAKVIPLGHEDFPENTTKSKEVSKQEEENSETKTVYDIADKILSNLQCDNDVDTACAIFNWVHSNIYYQTVHGNPTYEEAAYMGFTKKTGDCYVYFSCAKMLLDRARIPNLMVKRYPVVKNGHYWNLVQLNGEWYHCDATVFKDHPDLYFMLTDEEIADSHHEFDSSLYPERASRSYYDQDYYSGDVYDYSGDDVYFEDDWF